VDAEDAAKQQAHWTLRREDVDPKDAVAELSRLAHDAEQTEMILNARTVLNRRDVVRRWRRQGSACTPPPGGSRFRSAISKRDRD
jgi:hypothetical protein